MRASDWISTIARMRTGTIVLLLIRGYQVLLSPLFGNCCRYYPSCSEYTYESVLRNGARKGIWAGFRRILRCHPWAVGGFDPPEVEQPGHEGTTGLHADQSVVKKPGRGFWRDGSVEKKQNLAAVCCERSMKKGAKAS